MKIANINSCAAVKRYSVIEKDGKKYLALRIKNGLPETITGLDVKVRQYDRNSRPLGTVILSTSTLEDGDGDFLWVSKTALSDKCDRCEAEIRRVCYGDYSYAKKGDGVTLTYTDGAARARDAKAFYSKSEGSNQVLSHNHIKYAVGVGVLSVILIILALAVCIFQIEFFKQTSDEFAMSGVVYKFVDADKKDDTDIVISGYNGRYGDITIPEKIEGHRVVGIRDKVFEGSSDVRSVTIESSTLSVPDNAFKNCQNLASVKLVGVKRVGDNAFYNCKNLTSAEMQNVDTIGASAFARTGLRSLDLGGLESVSIGRNAFDYCTDLESVKFPDEVSFPLGGNSFLGSGVRNIEFGTLSPDISLISVFGADNKVEKITAKSLEYVPAAFCVGMKKLRQFTVEELADKNIGDYAFRDCGNLIGFDVGGAVTGLGREVFYNTAITSIDLSNINEIDAMAFYNCRALEDITLSATLETIGDSAFFGCASLRSVTLPVSTKAVGDSAFEECSRLTTVNLNDAISRIGARAFCGTAVTKIVFPDTVDTIGGAALKDADALVELKTPHFNTRENPETLSYLFGGDVPPSLARVNITLDASVSEGMFNGMRNIREVVLPDGLQEISAYMFASCESLEKVNMPAELTAINPYAFSGCSSLAEIEFPDGLKHISEYAFSGCSSIETLVVPKGVTVDPCAFYAMYGLKDLTVYTTEVAGDVGIYRLFSTSYSGVPNSLETVTLAEGSAVPDYAFYGLPSVNTVNIPVTVTTIGSYAFSHCRNLAHITLPDGLTSIGSYAFYDCIALNALLLPDGLESVESHAFTDSGITYMDVPANTDLSYGALYGMNALTALAINDIVSGGETTTLNALFGATPPLMLESVEIGAATAIADSSFAWFPSLKTVTIQGTPTSIESSAFEGCSALTDISLPTTVTAIGDRAFRLCESLTSLSLPRAVTSIGVRAFDGCTALQSVEFPAALRTIGDYAFKDCAALKSPTFPEGLSTLGSNAYNGCTFESITVPDGTSLYNYSLAGMDNLKEVTVPSTFTVNGYGRFCSLFGDETYFIPYTLEKVTLTAAARVPENAFSGCSSVKTVVLPDTVRTIEQNAFSYCSSLETAELPSALNSIGVNAFSYCGNLRSVKLPRSLSSIDSMAFYGCTKLYSVYNLSGLGLISGSPDNGYVAYYALKIMDSLDQKLDIIKVGDFGFAQADDLSWHLIEYYGIGGDLSLPESFMTNGVTVNSYSVGAQVFRNSDVTNLTVPKAVKKIGEYAFYSCGSLESVSFADGCETTLGESSFSSNDRLARVDFGNSVKIDADSGFVFSGCPSLTSVRLPEGMTSVGPYMFAYCYALGDVTLPDSLETIRGSAFYSCSSLKAIVLPENLSEIEWNAFSDCIRLYSVCNLSRRINVTAGDSGNGAVGANALKVSTTKAEFDGSAVTIDGYTFLSADDGYYLIASDRDELALERFSGATATITSYSIAPNAFKETAIRSVTMGAEVKKIGAHAFDGCTSIETAEIGASVSTIGVGAFENVNPATLIIRAKTFEGANTAFTYMYVGTVYYKGSASDWNRSNIRLSCNYLKTYASCVHSSSEWTEIGSEISTEVPPTETVVTKDATCTEPGTQIEKCTKCGATLQTYNIPIIEHSFDGSGVCKMCGAVRSVEKIDASNFATVFSSITNFECGDDGVIRSTAVSGKQSILTFTPDKAMTLTFTCGLNTYYGSGLTVTLNGRNAVYLTSGSRSCEFALSAGDEVRIIYTNNNSDGSSCYIKDISLTYITPSEESEH